jgi:hypothetical protein
MSDKIGSNKSLFTLKAILEMSLKILSKNYSSKGTFSINRVAIWK